MNISKYAYVYARIRARMGDILSEGRLRTLIDAENKENFLSSLMESPYKDQLMKATSKDLRNVEKALKEELIDQYFMVIRSTRGEIRGFFVDILRKFEVENLKAIIREKTTTAVTTGEPLLFLSVETFFRRKISKLREVESVESVVKLLEKPYKDILEEVVPEYEKSKKVLILEDALDKEIFGAIWRRIERLRAEDQKIVRRIIGTEFDIANLMTLLRCISAGVEEKEMRKYFLPYGYAFDFDSREAKASISAENLGSAIRLLPSTPYKEVLEKVLTVYRSRREKVLIPFEYALREFFFKTIKNMLKNYPVNMSTIIGFLYLKEIEVRNLCAIAVCKENGIPAEEIAKIIML